MEIFLPHSSLKNEKISPIEVVFLMQKIIAIDIENWGTFITQSVLYNK